MARAYGLLLSLLLVGGALGAHPMPNTLLQLKIWSKEIRAELQIPLVELQAAWGLALDQDQGQGFVQQHQGRLKAYLLEHTRVQSESGAAWPVEMGKLSLSKTENPINGTYYEVKAQLRILVPDGADVRHFSLYYDAVVHQVITHQIVVSVTQDWANGNLGEQAQQVGTIQLDIPSGKIFPLEVNLGEGTCWKGLQRMFTLGMEHIAAGTDHLLFLLALLLPSPLRREQRRWGGFGGIRYTLHRLIKLVTAFTIGHSLTLLMSTLGWVHFPAQPIEILIAVSILISVIHALWPVFAGREAWIALGFGLIHGLAFAETLSRLHLDLPQLLLSLLGFNLGIEWMQVLVVAAFIPALLWASQSRVYLWIKNGFAILIGLAALAWITERVSGNTNVVTQQVETLADFSPWLLLILTLFALLLLAWERRRKWAY